MQLKRVNCHFVIASDWQSGPQIILGLPTILRKSGVKEAALVVLAGKLQNLRRSSVR